MLIPSIDLQNGHVVQLVQGEKLAIEAPDAEPWIQRFSRFPRVQLIDLDAARGRGDNAAIVGDICRRLPCRVGGGIRSVERAREVLGSGAHAVIASSALFRDGVVDVAFARSLAAARRSASTQSSTYVKSRTCWPPMITSGSPSTMRRIHSQMKA